MDLSNPEVFILALGAMGLGIVMLIRGGDWTIDSAVYIARKIGVSPLIVGFTIVAFGTSLPELVISINANLKDSPGIALGNVLGSNIANILLVCGAAAMISTLSVQTSEILNDTLAMIGATIAMAGIFLMGIITQSVGMAMFGALILYVVFQYYMALKGEKHVDDVEEPEFKQDWMAYLFLLLGLVFIAIGAEFLVRGAQVSATFLGVPEAVIALSLIALGTSLPELSTCIAAALKKQSDIIIGNIIGSNVFNILMIIGVTAMIKPIDIGLAGPEIVGRDMWITIGVTLIFALWILLFKSLGKLTGLFFVLGYLIYILAIYGLYTL